MIKNGKGQENNNNKDEWYQLLVCSIVRQSVEEFRYYLSKLHKTNSENVIKSVKNELERLVRFYNSDWFETISPIYKSVLCGQLKKEIREYLKKNKKYQEFLKEIMEEL